jgi:pimeloyl-ACP methyl ester carboxylesterase
VLVGPTISGYVSRTPAPFTADLIAALQQRNYKRASEVLLGSSVFAVRSESQALVRQMVIENDRLWSVPRELMRQTERPAFNRLDEISENDLVEREQAEVLARRVTGARLVIIPGGGHLLNLTSPEEFRAEMSQFVR